jgi:hypothetical protein
MLNLVQHLTKSRNYETLKRVQGDKLGLFKKPFFIELKNLGIANFKIPKYLNDSIRNRCH